MEQINTQVRLIYIQYWITGNNIYSLIKTNYLHHLRNI